MGRTGERVGQFRSDGAITEADHGRERADIHPALGLEDPPAPAGLPDSRVPERAPG